MKFLFISLLSVISVISVCGYADPNAVRLRYARNPTPLKCTKTERVCSDCSTLAVCSSLSADPLVTMTCIAPNEYCVDGACTSKPGSSCQGIASVQSTFKCTDVGIFPDPSDCTRYHVCEQGSVNSFKCDIGFVYNSKLKMCHIGRTPCTKISCSKASDVNTLVPYASDPAYYALCTKDDKGYSALMFKCPNEDFEEFDVKTKTCQFLCKAKGNFQDPNDCGKYFSCTGKNAKPISAKCPGALVFDGTGCNRDKDKCQFKPQGGSPGGGSPGGGSPGGGSPGGGSPGGGSPGGGSPGGGSPGGGSPGGGSAGGGSTEDDLSEPKSVADDSVVSNLMGVKTTTTDIITKICETHKDQAGCLTAITEVVAENFRKKTDADGVTTYFVSVKANDGQTYHVKITYKSITEREILNVIPKQDTDEIVEFL